MGEGGLFLSAWLYYLAAMIYDIAMLCISSFYLTRFRPVAGRYVGAVQIAMFGTDDVPEGCLVLYDCASLMPECAGARNLSIFRRMLYDGLGYFAVLTGTLFGCDLSPCLTLCQDLTY